MGETPPQTFLTTLSSPPSEVETWQYYARIPSGPRLVARASTTPWERPTGPEAYSVPKELRTVGNHAIKEVWEDKLAFEVQSLLESMKVKWTSMDVVRMAIAEEPSAPVILWVGVVPGSLSGDRGVTVASNCRHLVEKYNIVDVDVEIRESIVTRSAGPQLLTPGGHFDFTVNAREPLTPTIGLSICAQATPLSEGTGGIFIGEGGNNGRLLLLTARHVVFKPDQDNNQHFEHRNPDQSPHEVTLFGQPAFKKYLESIEEEIVDMGVSRELLERRIEMVEGRDDPQANKERNHAQLELKNAEDAMEDLTALYKDISTRWATPKSRLLGHVILSPPIEVAFGGEGYTEDWALIEIDKSKINASNFDGNAIDLGTLIPIGEFSRMMEPHRQYDQPRSFNYPYDRLLRIKGTISDEEMRNYTPLNQNSEPCLMVIKRGSATGLTVGCANNVCSYVRSCYDSDDDNARASKEWAILPRNSESRAFSAEGDSGSIIVDGLGRVGGLLTGGAGDKALDISYATPINFLLKRMRELGVHEPHLEPSLTT